MNLDYAYVLHQYPYQNSSSLLKLFTKQQGLVTVIAKAAKRNQSPWRGLLQNFLPLLVQLSGRGEVLNLRQVELGAPQAKLASKALLSAFYCNELLLKFLASKQPNSSLFYHYQQTLLKLTQAPYSPTIRIFEKILLQEIGHGVPLVEDQNHNAIDCNFYYLLTPGHMPVQTTNLHQPQVYSGADLLAISQGDWYQTPSTLSTAKVLLQHWINYYNPGAPLKTPGLLNSMIRHSVISSPLAGEEKESVSY